MQILLAHVDKLAYKSSKIINGNKIIPEYYPTILCGDFNCANHSKLYEFVKNSKLPNYRELNRNVISGQHETSRSYKKIENTLLPEEIGISDQSQFKVEVDQRLAEKAATSPNLQAYCTFGGTHLRHTFAFKSVYDHIVNDQLEVTSCIQDQKKIVDFIFYHSEKHEPYSINSCEIEDKSTGDLCQENPLKRPLIEDIVEKDELELMCKLRLFTVSELDDVSLPNKDYPSDHFLLAAKFILN